MIIGHQKIIKLLDRSIAKDTVNHAYLFTGPEHAGKFKVALEFAEKLNGGNLDISSEIMVLSPEREEIRGVIKEKDISVEQIRDLQRKLNMTAYNDKYRIAIIDGAEKMGHSAQNSLLKILEEPPQKCVLILVSQDEKKILVTVKSRCRRIKFSLVSKGEIERMLSSEHRNKAEILFWSLGRPGLAVRFLEDRSQFEKREEMKKELESLFFMSAAEKFDLAESVSKDTAGLLQKMNSWIVILRETLIGKSKKDRITPQKSLELIGTIEDTIGVLKKTNANSRLALENLFLRFV